MGRLGWQPIEYYLSSPYEFFAACEGYFDKLEDQERLIRKQTHLLLLPHAKNGSTDLGAYWGHLFSEHNNMEKIKPLTQEDIIEIQRRHNLVFKNITQNGRA